MSETPIKCDYCQGNRAMMLWQGECAACIKAERDTLRQRVQEIEKEREIQEMLIGSKEDSRAAAIRREDELKKRMQELTEKGESLCHQNGNLLIENHDLKKRVQELEAEVSKAMDALDGYGRTNPGLVEAAEEAVRSSNEWRIEACGLSAKLATLEAEIERLKASTVPAKCYYYESNGKWHWRIKYTLLGDEAETEQQAKEAAQKQLTELWDEIAAQHKEAL